MELEPAEVFRVHHVPLLFESAAAHQWMVYDARRVGQFRRAIQETVTQGDVVVDLGTGMGLLAFLCARAGARGFTPSSATPSSWSGPSAWPERTIWPSG